MSTGRPRVTAIRGATTVDVDQQQAIVGAAAELLREMLARNDLSRDDLISIIFTSTPDLTAGFPAAAGRELGIGDVPVLGAAELAVAGSLPRCVRVLLHAYSTRPRHDIRHVYLREARRLRTDLAG